MKIIYLIFISTLFLSCDEHFETKDLYGYYTSVNYRNTFDTLRFLPDGVYQRKIYNQSKKIVLEMHGKWLLINQHSLKIDSYFLNLDRDLVKFPELVNDTSMTITTNFEIRNRVIQFCVGYHDGENCYQKVK